MAIIKKKQLGVAIIGLGVGEQHLIAFKNSKFINNIYIFDKNQKKTLKIKKKYKDVEICNDLKKIYQNPKIDIISIASYDQFHYEQIYNSLKNDKHVFCEKPICQNEKQLKNIENLLKKKRWLKMTTNTVLRTSKRFIEIKKKIKEGFFGDIYYLELDYNYGRLKKITEGWRGKINDYSVILGGGIHLVDLLIWYLNAKPKKISAFSNNFCTKNSIKNVNDQVTALIQLTNKIIIKLSCNFGCVYPHFHRIMIYGTNGTLEQSFNNEMVIKKRGQSYKTSALKKEDYKKINKGALIKNFIDGIIYDKPLIVPQNEMLDAMKFCFKINNNIT